MPIDVAQLEPFRGIQVFQNLSSEHLRTIARAAERVSFAADEVVFRQGDAGDAMYVVLSGQVEISLPLPGDDRVAVNRLGPGGHFGELALITGQPRSTQVIAETPVVALRIGHGEFAEIAKHVPEFITNLLQSVGRWLQSATAAEQNRLARRVVVVLDEASSWAILAAACREVQARGLRVAIVSTVDPPDGIANSLAEIEHVRLTESQEWTIAEVMQRASPRAQVVLVACGAAPPRGGAELLIEGAARAVFVLRSPDERARATLSSWADAYPALDSRSFVVCTDCASPTPAANLRLPTWRVVRMHSADARSRACDVAGLARLLIGKRRGLALGGGGARGLAHLGVVEFLQSQGVEFDLVAGTSMGALVGSFLAADHAWREVLDFFNQDLQVPRFWKRIPRGRAWHFLWMSRSGGWERKLRRYFPDTRIESLFRPFFSVTVDLVAGDVLVREQGDLVDSLLESINFPGATRPILRDGHALVDGGVLNNVPVDVLRERGADVVVAVDVSSRITRAERRVSARRSQRPTFLETFTRIFEIQQHRLIEVRAGQADARISPDTSAFSFFDLDQAVRLAEVGRAAAEAAWPEIERALGG